MAGRSGPCSCSGGGRWFEWLFAVVNLIWKGLFCCAGLGQSSYFLSSFPPVFGVGSATYSKFQCQTDVSVAAGDRVKSIAVTDGVRNYRARCYASAIRPRGVAIPGPRGLGQYKGFVREQLPVTPDNSALSSCLSAIV